MKTPSVIVGFGLAFAALSGAAPGPVASPPAAPSRERPGNLLPPSERSPRNANYTIQARLDPSAQTIDGTLELEWRNTTGAPQATLPFHLYWNAFRNTLSTSARGQGRRAARPPAGSRERAFGYTDVTSVQLLDGNGQDAADLTGAVRHVQPDDGNRDDRTVMEVALPRPVEPGGTARLRVGWRSKVPHGAVGRAGWVHDYYFIAQWFPKIGVFWKGAWNAHQFHPRTEFFSDYGVYDVQLTLPRGFVVGATGGRGEPRENADGTQTLRFVQEDVHDFAWTASRRFREKTGRFEDPGYPPVDLRLLVQPEHEHLSERYLEAARIALRHYGAWSTPYPYPHLTIVDPAWGSGSGGMEYPTLITGGASIWAPEALQSPETVTIHEAGHQFWYGLVGTNEFEEAWLDEGFNRYHDRKAAFLALGPRGVGRRYFGLAGVNLSGWPVVAPGVYVGHMQDGLSDLRRLGKTDVLARRGWEYRTSQSYGFNAYTKPALSLQTLEGLLGEDTMTRVLQTYARRYKFGHPTSQDFIGVVNEVTGRDWQWYFDQTWFSSDLCDYAVEVRNGKNPALEGYTEGPDGRPVPAPGTAADSLRRGAEAAGDHAEVTLLRLGEVRLPVEVMIDLSDGRTVHETWDGQYRWARFRYPGVKVRRAVVDPQGRIHLDVNPVNNTWVEEAGPARRAAAKYAARWMLWLQAFLEMHTVLG
jgi:hypothetical protein